MNPNQPRFRSLFPAFTAYSDRLDNSPTMIVQKTHSIRSNKTSTKTTYEIDLTSQQLLDALRRFLKKIDRLSQRVDGDDMVLIGLDLKALNIGFTVNEKRRMATAVIIDIDCVGIIDSATATVDSVNAGSLDGMTGASHQPTRERFSLPPTATNEECLAWLRYWLLYSTYMTIAFFGGYVLANGRPFIRSFSTAEEVRKMYEMNQNYSFLNPMDKRTRMKLRTMYNQKEEVLFKNLCHAADLMMVDTEPLETAREALKTFVDPRILGDFVDMAM